MKFEGFPTVPVAAVVDVLVIVIAVVIIVAAPAVGFYFTIRCFVITKHQHLYLWSRG